MDTLWPNAISRVVEQTTEDLQRKRTRLTAERSAIDDQLQQIESELSELEIAVRVWRRFAENAPVSRPRSTPPEAPADEPVARPIGRPTTNGTTGTLDRLEGMTVADAAEQALRFLGGEAAGSELRELLVNRGAIKPDHDSYGYLLKQMRIKPNRFAKVARGRWALAEVANRMSG